MSSFLRKLSIEGHPLAAKWKTFWPFALIEKLSDDTNFFPAQWLFEQISDLGLTMSCWLETKPLKTQEQASNALDNLHKFRKDPTVIQVVYNILVKPRVYKGSHSIRIRKETGEQVYQVIPNQHIADVHFGQGLYQDVLDQKITTAQIVMMISDALESTEFAQAPLFNTSVLATQIATELGLPSWKLPGFVRAFRNMFVSYGQHAVCNIQVDQSDIKSIWITEEDSIRLKQTERLFEVDEEDNLDRFSL
jgi:hypothetical protein